MVARAAPPSGSSEREYRRRRWPPKRRTAFCLAGSNRLLFFSRREFVLKSLKLNKRTALICHRCGSCPRIWFQRCYPPLNNLSFWRSHGLFKTQQFPSCVFVLPRAADLANHFQRTLNGRRLHDIAQYADHHVWCKMYWGNIA